MFNAAVEPSHESNAKSTKLRYSSLLLVRRIAIVSLDHLRLYQRCKGNKILSLDQITLPLAQQTNKIEEGIIKLDSDDILRLKSRHTEYSDKYMTDVLNICQK